jgi:hypothetical protein
VVVISNVLAFLAGPRIDLVASSHNRIALDGAASLLSSKLQKVVRESDSHKECICIKN